MARWRCRTFRPAGPAFGAMGGGALTAFLATEGTRAAMLLGPQAQPVRATAPRSSIGPIWARRPCSIPSCRDRGGGAMDDIGALFETDAQAVTPRR